MKLSDILSKLTGLEARAEEAFKQELAALRSTVDGVLTQTRNDLDTALKTIETIGAEKTGLESRLTALEAAAKLDALNLATARLSIARQCLNAGCMEFQDADGKPLAKDADDAALTAASALVAIPAMVESFSTALHTAASRIGVELSTIPATNGVAAASEADEKILAQYAAITDPKERVAFYRKNKAAYDAAFRRKNS